MILIFLSFFFSTNVALACLSDEYKDMRYHCNKTSVASNLLRVIYNSQQVYRIAVVGGISTYPNLSQDQQLPAAEHDIVSMAETFVSTGYDEVIILRDSNFSTEKLDYIFRVYIPFVLGSTRYSQVTFSYSGHGGYFDDEGYIFLSNTETISPDNMLDTQHALSMDYLRLVLSHTARRATHFLALINSCYGGSFFTPNTAAFGSSDVLYEQGSHAITAGSDDQLVYSRSDVGSGKGSVFFEVVSRALKGEPVEALGQLLVPTGVDDGILTASELSGFLDTTFALVEGFRVTPQFGRFLRPEANKLGQFVVVTDEDLAKTALARKYPEQYRSVFFGESGDSFAKGFEPPPANPGVPFQMDITSTSTVESIPGIKFIDDFWNRKTVIVAPAEGIRYTSPVAAESDGSIFLYYFESGSAGSFFNAAVGATLGYPSNEEIEKIKDGSEYWTLLDAVSVDGNFDALYGSEKSMVRLVEFDTRSGSRHTIQLWSDTSCAESRALSVTSQGLLYITDCEPNTARRYEFGSKLPAKSTNAPWPDAVRRFPSSFSDNDMVQSPDGRYVAATYNGYVTPEDSPLYLRILGLEGVVVPEQGLFHGRPSGEAQDDNLLDSETVSLRVFDSATSSPQTIFSQPYDGLWNISHLVWSEDSARLYFDNSGAIACIWYYEIERNELRKIIPEHSALSPYPFEFGGDRYIVYVDTTAFTGSDIREVIMLAVEPEG